MSFAGDEDNGETKVWVTAIDGGGLWHVNDMTFMLFWCWKKKYVACSQCDNLIGSVPSLIGKKLWNTKSLRCPLSVVIINHIFTTAKNSGTLHHYSWIWVCFLLSRNVQASHQTKITKEEGSAKAYSVIASCLSSFFTLSSLVTSEKTKKCLAVCLTGFTAFTSNHKQLTVSVTNSHSSIVIVGNYLSPYKTNSF